MRTMLLVSISAIGIAMVGPIGADALPVNAAVIGEAASANSHLIEAYYGPYHPSRYYRSRYQRSRHCFQNCPGRAG
jgi:hypothetical protein